MCNHNFQFDGIHAHKIIKITIKENFNYHRQEEISTFNLTKKPPKMDFSRSVNMLAFDEMD